jgi:hypothetical protein
MLRKLIPASVILILLTGDAFSQPGGSSGNTGSSMPMTLTPGERRRTPEELQRDREIEAQYNRTVNEKIPDKKAPADPWGNIRSGPASSASKQQR